jgi:hypothetical protein
VSKCKNCKEPLPLDMVQVGGVHMKCEQEYFHSKTERMIKMRPGEGFPFAIMEPDEAADMVKELMPAAIGYQVEAVWMSKGAIEALPEFEGW